MIGSCAKQGLVFKKAHSYSSSHDPTIAFKKRSSSQHTKTIKPAKMQTSPWLSTFSLMASRPEDLALPGD
jgi:hypothetical protein